MKSCKGNNITIYNIFLKESIELLSDKLIAPLQVKHYATSTKEKIIKGNIKPITPDIINNVILTGINGIEASNAMPEYAGKMNYYLNLLDDLVKELHENSSIGIILSSTKDKFDVEYAPCGVLINQLAYLR